MAANGDDFMGNLRWVHVNPCQKYWVENFFRKSKIAADGNDFLENFKLGPQELVFKKIGPIGQKGKKHSGNNQTNKPTDMF